MGITFSMSSSMKESHKLTEQQKVNIEKKLILRQALLLASRDVTYKAIALDEGVQVQTIYYYADKFGLR